MNMHPTGWRLVVEPLEISERTAGGIVVPDNVREDMAVLGQIGKVIAMGNLCYDDVGRLGHKPWCQIGDYVVYGKYAGISLPPTKDKRKRKVLNDDEIIGTVDDPTEFARNY